VKAVLWSPAAKQDLADIWLYTANQWGVDQADIYTSQIEHAVRKAADFSGIGSAASGLAKDYRKLRSGSHRVIYKESQIRIIVVRVLHRRQDVPDDLEDF